MQKYGIIKNGELAISDVQLDGYKPVKHKSIPEDFNQLTQYAVAGEITETENEIIVGVEIKELEVVEEATE